MASVRTGARRRTGHGIGAIAAIAAWGFTVVGPSAGAEAQEVPASVRVVHGLRGLVADVYLDGALALPTFQPERATEPLAVPAGDHLVEIRTGGAAATEAPLLSQVVTVPPAFQGSLVAHLDQAGAPTLTAFADDLSPVPAGHSRLVVRHVAAAEDVNVVLNGAPASAAITAKAEASQQLAAGPYQLAVIAAGGGSVLTAPQQVEFPDGTVNFMYLIGAQADQTLGWAAVRVEGLQSAPAMIQTGDGSMRSDRGDGGFELLAVVAVLGAGGTLGLVTRLRHAALRQQR